MVAAVVAIGAAARDLGELIQTNGDAELGEQSEQDKQRKHQHYHGSGDVKGVFKHIAQFVQYVSQVLIIIPSVNFH